MDRFFRYKLDHIIFWVLTVFFHGYTRLWLINKADFTQFLIEVIFRNALMAAIIYTNLLVILPRFMDHKKYLAGISFMLLLVVSYALLKSFHDEYLYGVVLGEFPKRAPEAQFFYNLSIITF